MGDIENRLYYGNKEKISELSLKSKQLAPLIHRKLDILIRAVFAYDSMSIKAKFLSTILKMFFHYSTILIENNF